MDKPHRQDALHVPVLLEEVLQYLAPREGENYLDLTAGYGGHASAVLDNTRSPEGMVLVDRDQNAVRELRSRFGSDITVIGTDFLTATDQLLGEERRFDMILADLGVSSPHLDMADRGFSLSQDGPLDMRMDQNQALTAERIANNYPEEQLAEILREYGEEPKARQIARAIVQARPLASTTELAAVIARQWRGASRAKSKIHPATRTFQAIRIAVNNELGLLQESLPKWINLLKPGGRLVIVSFQSLEDRIVKQFFSEMAGDYYDSELRLLTKRPVTASQTELVNNPRARSAKLRAVVKIKTNTHK